MENRLFAQPVPFLILVGMAVAGCTGLQPDGHMSVTETMNAKAQEHIAAGGIAYIGTGSSATVAIALDMAKKSAHEGLAEKLKERIEELYETFSQEVGGASAVEHRALFWPQTGVHPVHWNSPPRDLKFETVGGMTSAWALMVQSPRHIETYLRWQGKEFPVAYGVFLASQTYNTLMDDVRSYEKLYPQPRH